MKRVALLCLAAVLSCSACASVYEHSSRTAVDVAGQSRDAILYWFTESGRMYYLAEHEQTENTAELRVCGAMPVELVDTGGAEGVVLLASDAGGDFVVKQRDATGALIDAPPERQRGGAPTCGKLYVRRGEELETVHLEEIEDGDRLVLDVLCERRPATDRPSPRSYELSALTREEDDSVTAPKPCPTSPTGAN